MSDTRILPALARAGRRYFSIREAEAEAWHIFRFAPSGPDERRKLWSAACAGGPGACAR